MNRSKLIGQSGNGVDLSRSGIRQGFRDRECFSESRNLRRVPPRFVGIVQLTLTLALACVAALPALAADPPTVSSGTISLRGGDQLTGKLLPSESAEWVRWHGDAFVDPFEFSRQAVAEINFDTVNKTLPRGAIAVSCRNGDTLIGTLVDWTADTIELRSDYFGEVEISTSAVARLCPVDSIAQRLECDRIRYGRLAGVRATVGLE